jgi:hypothetical protein
MSLSAILAEAYNFFRNHVRQLAALTLPLLLIQVVIQLWLGQEMLNADMENPEFSAVHGVAMMALLIIFSLLIAALTLFLQLRSEGHDLKSMDIIKASVAYVPPLLLAGVFSGLAILAPVMLFAAFGPFWIIGLAVSFYLFSRLMLYVPLSLLGGGLTTLTKAGGLPVQMIIETGIAFIGLYVNLVLFRLYMVNREKKAAE